jgi:hypothetical protein
VLIHCCDMPMCAGPPLQQALCRLISRCDKLLAYWYSIVTSTIDVDTKLSPLLYWVITNYDASLSVYHARSPVKIVVVIAVNSYQTLLSFFHVMDVITGDCSWYVMATFFWCLSLKTIDSKINLWKMVGTALLPANKATPLIIIISNYIITVTLVSKYIQIKQGKSKLS